jgi:hypothetical protein
MVCPLREGSGVASEEICCVANSQEIDLHGIARCGSPEGKGMQ